MLTLKRQSNGKRLSLKDHDQLGGETRQYYRVPAEPSLAAKVFSPPELGDKGLKLRAMLANPPADPMQSKNQISIAWPTDLLLDPAETVVGYLMPNLQGMQKVSEFFLPTERQQKHSIFSYRRLLSAAVNLASAVNALHKSGYVIGGINESSILVKDNSLVTLINTDSIQVSDHNGQIYRCGSGKEDYTPPELQGAQFDALELRPEHDLFGLSVLIFQLLMEGIHPYDGKFLGDGSSPLTGERIKQGFFPHGRSRSVPFEPEPNAPPFTMLSPAIQQLFLKCFDDGHDDPAARPTAQMWRQGLKKALKELADCPDNPLHCYDQGLSQCPWCERALKLGVDFFSPPAPPPAPSPAPEATPPQSPVDPPVINHFGVSSDSITAGEELILSWDVAHAENINIGGIGEVPAQGSIRVSPPADITYTIEALNGPHLVSDSVAVTVIIVPPVINLFQASSDSIRPGQSVILEWYVDSAQTVEIDNGIGRVARQRIHTIWPQKTTTYTMTARSAGGTVQKTVKIKIVWPSLRPPVALRPTNVTLKQPAKLKWPRFSPSFLTVQLLSRWQRLLIYNHLE